MTDHRYFRYTLHGNLAPQDAIRALGAAAAEAQVVRVESTKDRTCIYLATLNAPPAEVEGAQLEEVSEPDATGLGEP
jgi:hypothetical protein